MLATTTPALDLVILAMDQDQAKPPPKLFMPTQTQVTFNATKLPTHALFTSHLKVESSTGAALKHGTADLHANECAWMVAIYKAGLDAKYKSLLKSSKGDLYESACASPSLN